MQIYPALFAGRAYFYTFAPRLTHMRRDIICQSTLKLLHLLTLCQVWWVLVHRVSQVRQSL